MMATITGTTRVNRNSLLRSIVLGGLIVGIADAIIYHWLVSSVLEGNPLLSVYQYLASGALGMLPSKAVSAPLCSGYFSTSSFPLSSLPFLS